MFPLNTSVHELVIVTLTGEGQMCTVYWFFLPWLFLFLPCSSSFHLKDVLTTIGEKVCLEVSSCLSLSGFAPFTMDKETVLKGQIQAVASPDDPIRRIMGTFGGRQKAGITTT